MRIFEIGRGGLKELEHVGFKREYEIKRTVVENFGTFFPWLDLIKSEFPIGNVTLDALAFDDKEKAFVIMEYKNADNRDISDQVSIYYDRLQQNKERCRNALSEKRNKVVKERSVRWEKTYLIFVRPKFSKKQIEASNSVGQRVTELCEIRRYPNHLTISKVNVAGKERAPVSSRRRTKPRPVVSDSLSEDAWIAGDYRGTKITPQTRSLYNDLKRLLHVNFGLEHVQRRKWASFRLNDSTQVCSVILRKHRLLIVYATTKRIWPPNDFVLDISNVRHYGKGNYCSYIETESDVQRAMKYVGIVYKDITDPGPRYVPRLGSRNRMS